MKHQSYNTYMKSAWFKIQRSRIISGCIMIFVALSFTVYAEKAEATWPNIVPSKDGTPISYEVHGVGEPALIFVHGWSCDTRYWRNQISSFSQTHKVVLIDLAGHGHSGATRGEYTMKAFGEDVQAVTEVVGAKNVILIGHSMGGTVIAEAARLMPNRVKGLIGVDTLENIEYPLTPEQMDQMITPLQQNFKIGTGYFVKSMLSASTNARLQDWIIADMSAAQPSVALSAMKDYLSRYITGYSAAVFDDIKVPVVTVNGDMWPIDYEANRRHMASFEAIVIKGAEHFLMMNRPDDFNRALEKAIQMINQKVVSK